jgi:hypothetical protein
LLYGAATESNLHLKIAMLYMFFAILTTGHKKVSEFLPHYPKENRRDCKVKAYKNTIIAPDF